MKLFLIFFTVAVCSTNFSHLSKAADDSITYIYYPDASELFGRRNFSIA